MKIKLLSEGGYVTSNSNGPLTDKVVDARSEFGAYFVKGALLGKPTDFGPESEYIFLKDGVEVLE